MDVRNRVTRLTLSGNGAGNQPQAQTGEIAQDLCWACRSKQMPSGKPKGYADVGAENRKVEVLAEVRSYTCTCSAGASVADEQNRTEDWKTLPWKKFQRNVFRLQKRIYQAQLRGDTSTGSVQASSVFAACNGYCFALSQRDAWQYGRYRKTIAGKRRPAWTELPASRRHNGCGWWDNYNVSRPHPPRLHSESQ